jgi:hypothetical protein
MKNAKKKKKDNSAPVPLRPTRTTHEAIWD